MLSCFQIFDRKFFMVFKIKKCILKTIARGKICLMLFIRTFFFKKELRAGTSRQREHLLYEWLMMNN